MKPFDLDEYKKNPSRELVTRDGHKARIICTDKIGGFPIIALVFEADRETPYSYTELGHFVHGDANPRDLFFSSIKHQGWINIYKDEQGFRGQKIYDSEECATKASLCVTNYVATIPVEWEE